MQKLGVFRKIQDICYQMGTEIFKIEEEMTEKMSILKTASVLNIEATIILSLLYVQTRPPSFAG